MHYFYLAIITITMLFANTSVFVSDVNIQAGYIEVSIINEEPIVGFQFNITSSEELNADFGIELLNLYGQDLTGYTDQVFVGEEGFTIFGNENGLIVGFSLNSENLREISPSTSPEGQVLIRVPWSFDLDQTGSVGIDNPKFIKPGSGGGPPQYVESSFTEDYPLSIDKLSLPIDFELGEAYPNPFNPETLINYGLPIHSNISISIFDINGRQIKSLEESFKIPGRYSVMWDGLDDAGHSVSSGMYIYQMIANGYISSGKVMLLK